MIVPGKTHSLLALTALAASLPILSAQAPPTVTFTEYKWAGATDSSGITAGPDGAIWFSETLYGPPGYGSGEIWRITAAGVITQYPVPGYTSEGPSGGVAAGPDGALWFGVSLYPSPGGSAIGRITTAGVITEYLFPTAYTYPYGIAAGPDGALWFIASVDNGTDPSTVTIGRITTTGIISEYPVPTAYNYPGSITAGPDGALWFTESQFSQHIHDKIGRITTAGVLTEYPLPAAETWPAGITAGPDGALWFTEAWGHKIGRITTAGVITEYPLAFGPLNITAGPDGALWFTEEGEDLSGHRYGVLGRITTDGFLTEYSNPEWGLAGVIAAGPDGALWFTLDNTTDSAIVRAVIAPNPARANRAQQTAPVKLGTSGSNINDTGAVCCAGTLGALVTKGRAPKYILSNNHVLARLNTAKTQEPIIQRGYIDTVPRCSATGTVTVAALYDWVKLDFSGGNNIVDAAIAQINPGMVNSNGAIIGIGPISPATAAPAVEMLVMKAGRTTGKTTGSINALNVTARIGYQPCGGGAKQTAKFVQQFRMIPDVTFARAGDSGSLIVTVPQSGRPNPVGLLFAGAYDGSTLANPINAVLSALGVTFVGTASAAEMANAAALPVDPRMAAASQVKDRYDDYLLGLPEVVGHGVGYARDGSRQPVIQLYLRKATDPARQAAPASLEGVPIEIHETGEFQAIPACAP